MESNSKSILAKLLARENITIQHGNFSTAHFDVENRVLGLPMLKEMDKNVYDLFIGHEVGHALETPSDGWHNSTFDIPGCPRAFVNVVEDIRIEKLIQKRYPGLVNSFKKGYSNLMVQDFFGIGDKDINTMSFMNRLNLKSKLRDLVSVNFTKEEQPYVDMAMAVETWDDVIVACRSIYEYLKEKQKDEQKEQQESQPNGKPGETTDQDSSEENQSESIEQQPMGEDSEQNNNDDSDMDDSLDSLQGNTTQNKVDDLENKQDDEETEEVQKTLGSDGADLSEDIMDTSTDDNFRANEDKLIERDLHGNIPNVVNLCNSKQLDEMIVPYAEVAESRIHNNKLTFSQETVPDSMYGNEYKQELKSFIDETTKIVNVMVKEFEMRKAAFQYSRSKTSRTGSLNVNKLHEYKFNDDIFNKVTKLADAKSHGMIMLIDRSGSMRSILSSVLRQTLTLAMFCKKVGIPFDVYTFTSHKNQSKKSSLTLKVGDIDHKYVSMCHILSSTFKKATYTEAFNNLFYQTVGGEVDQRMAYSQVESMGSTPLIEVLTTLPELTARFKSKHGVQKVIMPLLTDGAPSPFGYVSEMYVECGRLCPLVRHNYYDRVVFNMGGNKYVRTKGNNITAHLLDYVRNLGVTTVGYFLAQSHRDFNSMVARASGAWSKEAFKEASKKVRAQNFVSYDNTQGYNRFFILKAERKSLSTDIDDFEVKEGARAGEITRAFKKYASAKKTNRIFAAQFAEIIS